MVSMHNLTTESPYEEITSEIPSEQNKHSRFTATEQLERRDDALLLVLPKRLQSSSMTTKKTINSH